MILKDEVKGAENPRLSLVEKYISFLIIFLFIFLLSMKKLIYLVIFLLVLVLTVNYIYKKSSQQ